MFIQEATFIPDSRVSIRRYIFIWKSRVLNVLNSYHDRNPSTTFDVANFDEFVESNKDLIFSGVKLFTV